ncbi:hypothetical protein BASA83_000481 [Batrachochytrium salamandrivorans]|nr:hypothetical protein BASA83_000481 [Batrachochytrium salamandrivorans]
MDTAVSAMCDVGIIGLGDMGKLYARMFVKAGWRVYACDLPEKYNDMCLEYKDTGISIVKDGFAVVRRCDFVVFSVEAMSIKAVVSKFGPAMKVGAIACGQTSVKTPEIAAFEEFLPPDVQIVTCHSLHGPSVNPSGQPLVVIRHRSTQDRFDLAIRILESLGSDMVFLDAAEHDRITADTQAVTHVAFLSMGTAWKTQSTFPWESAAYVGGIENVKVLMTLRIYGSKWHVYSGLALLNPSVMRQAQHYSQSVSDLFKLMIQENIVEFTSRIKKARKFVFGDFERNPILLSDSMLDQFSLGAIPKEARKPNSHLSLLAMVDCWARLEIKPYDHLICQTPPFRLLLGIAEFLFRNEDILDESIQAAIYDKSIRSDDCEFYTSTKGWVECIGIGSPDAYRQRFESTAAFFADRTDQARQTSEAHSSNSPLLPSTLSLHLYARSLPMASTAPSSASTFHLSAVLIGHSQDVRALAALDANTLVSASRDQQVIVWQRLIEGGSQFVQKTAFAGHSHFVNSVVCVPSSEKCPTGLVYSGGSDKIIYAFDPNHADEPLLTLIGHTENVCALSLAENGDLLSGSWDKTAKVWRDGVELHTLSGHTQAVWSVLAVDSDTYLTASADKTIKFWVGAKNTKTFTKHKDVVRSLTLVPGVGFASCSNDGAVFIWNFDGVVLSELYGHTSFVYSLDCLPSGELITGGEDRSVRVWKDNGLLQTMTQPCTSVWCVAAIPNGDIMAGGSDGVVRVFTRSSTRRAETEIIQAFDAEVSKTSIPSNSIGDVDKSKLPGLDALGAFGTKDGEVKMIRVGNVVEAHQWSVAESQWIKIGEVVDAIGNSRKQLFQGKEYDYVFDVDIQEGVPPLKLPYNASDNPYQAAQTFIDRNDLPPGYLEQIAEFIIKNAAAVNIGADESRVKNADPFTGESRYIPGNASGSSNTIAAQPSLISPNSSSLSSTSSSKLIPMKDYTFFKAINFKAVINKVLQINSEIEKSMDFGDLALKADQEQCLEKLIKNIEAGNLSDFDKSDFQILSLLAFKWPEASRFPGIDLLRMTVLYTPSLINQNQDFIDSLFQAAHLPIQDVTVMSKEQETNAMLVMRTLSNMFSQEGYHSAIYDQRQKFILYSAELVKKSENKNLRISLATLYLNLVVLMCKQAFSFDDAVAVDVLESLNTMLVNETDGEALFRELVAIGTILAHSAAAREAALLLDIKDTVVCMRKRVNGNEARLASAEAEVIALLP